MTRSKLVFLQQQPSKNRCTCTCTFMGPNFRISSSRPHRLFFRWNGRKIGVKRVKRRPRQSYLLSLAHTPNTNEQKQGNTNYFTSSDPHHDMLGGGCQVRVVIENMMGRMENLRTLISGFLGLVILVRWALVTMFLS